MRLFRLLVLLGIYLVMLSALASRPTERVAGADTVDSDGDGCTDEQELGPDPNFGGGRDPLYFWDFFDTPTAPEYARDRVISIGDMVAVLGRFGSSRDPVPSKEAALAEALSKPPPAPAYHPAYDRRPVAGRFSGPPNGAITILDVMLVSAQFGDRCA